MYLFGRFQWGILSPLNRLSCKESYKMLVFPPIINLISAYAGVFNSFIGHLSSLCSGLMDNTVLSIWHLFFGITSVQTLK